MRADPLGARALGEPLVLARHQSKLWALCRLFRSRCVADYATGANFTQGYERMLTLWR